MREFHGSKPCYEYHDFADLDFLRCHHFAGDPLLEEIRKGDSVPIMPSAAMIEELRKKARFGLEEGSSLTRFLDPCRLLPVLPLPLRVLVL